MADAVNYRWFTGCSWRMLPHDFPPWKTVYAQFRRWHRAGLLRSVRAIALARKRSSPGNSDTTGKKSNASRRPSAASSPGVTTKVNECGKRRVALQ